VGVGRRQPNRQRDPAAVDHQVVLGASLAAIYRIGTGQLPPCLARTLRLSSAALDQSIWPSSPSHSNNRWCSCSTLQPVARPAAAASRGLGCRSPAPERATAARACWSAAHRSGRQAPPDPRSRGGHRWAGVGGLATAAPSPPRCRQGPAAQPWQEAWAGASSSKPLTPTSPL
jgi:hypothetical protein